MRKLLLALLALVVLVVLSAGALLAALDTDWGRARIAALVERVTAGTGSAVKLTGLSGSPLDRLRVARIDVADARGPWLRIEEAELAWSPRRLAGRRLALEALTAGRVELLRLPIGDDGETQSGAGTLPVDVTLERYAIARLEIAPAIAGAPLAVALTGSFALERAGSAALTLAAHHVARPEDRLELRWRHDSLGVIGSVDLVEAADGWIARRLGLESTPPLALRADLAGPWRDARVVLTAQADPARLSARGSIDLATREARLDISGDSGRMRPQPDLAWESLSLAARVSGPLLTPLLQAQLELRGVEAGAATAKSVRLTSDGTHDGRTAALKLGARIEALQVPGPLAERVMAAPLQAEIEIRLDGGVVEIDSARVAHPLGAVAGRGRYAEGRIAATLDVDVAEIAAPLAAFGVTAGGAMRATAEISGTARALDVTLQAQSTSLRAQPPIDALLGTDPTLSTRLRITPDRIDIARLALNGSALQVEASGTLSTQEIAADFTASLADAGALLPGLGGGIAANGQVSGPLDALSLRARLTSDALTRDALRLDALRIELQAEALPRTPRASLSLAARLGESPVQVDARGERAADGTWRVAIGNFDFPGLTATGEARGRDARIADARLQADARSLAPLGALLGVPLAGSGTLSLTSAGDPLAAAARLEADLQLREVRVDETRARRLSLRAVMEGDLAAPRIASSTLEVDDLRVGDHSGELRIEAQGPLDALRMTARFAVPTAELRGRVEGIAALAPAPQLRLTASELRLRGETVSLRGPARLAWEDGLRIEQLRLALGGGTVGVDGRVAASGTELRVSAARVPLALLALVDPALAADGAVDGELRLAGPLDSLGGSLRLRAQGIRLRDGPGRGLPQGRLRLDADIARGSARVTGEIALGQSAIRTSGTVPLSPDGALAIDVQGSVDLALADPVLTPDGRRARGRLRVQAALRGSPAVPTASGTLNLAEGVFEDSLNGLRFDRISGEARLEDRTITAMSLRARAGRGEVTLSGSLGLDPRAAPVDLRLVMRDARLSQSRQATIVAGGDVALRGRLPDAVRAEGRIDVARAEFQLAEPLPSELPRLEVDETGDGPQRVQRRPVQASEPLVALSGVALDLAVELPGSVFVRGRGVDAQAGGTLRVSGNAADPIVAGDVALRRGSFTVVGQRLDFSRGAVRFDGAAYTDPQLDFEARRASGGITAILHLGGRPSQPEVTLSSEPEMPTDEILARLLLGRSLAELSPLEIAQIAQGAASLFIGDPAGGRIDDLRRRLGLDQLRIAPTRDGSGVGLEAGRTVAPGVYVGVRPGKDPTTPSGTVQIEITPRLRLETDIGTTGRAGITYEFDY
jgi:translocation and assembly module TamB